MKKCTVLLLISFWLCLSVHATDSVRVLPQKYLNFFIMSRHKKGKLDLATRFNLLRTKIRSLCRGDRFVSIMADNARDMDARILYRLKKYNARIGTLWFDSHGMYKKGHSLFFIGSDEFNYLNIRDSLHVQPLQALATFCNASTHVVIGSCYGGATFKRAGMQSPDSSRMNGDSLMMGLSKALNGATIYGSESWVMTKPGLFQERGAVEGYPARKLFMDMVYRPAWENVGVWNTYTASSGTVCRIPPVTMDRHGNLLVRPASYLSKKRHKKRVDKKICRLQPGLIKS